MSNAICFLMLGLLSGLSMQAEEITSTATNDNPGVWEFECERGAASVKIDAITSVSTHEYLIDGGVRVYECTMDTTGTQSYRFYCLEPVVSNDLTNVGKQVMTEAAKASGGVVKEAGAAGLEVIKHYPTTTHAKTSEYRFENRDTIQKIYRHIARTLSHPADPQRQIRVVR